MGPIISRLGSVRNKKVLLAVGAGLFVIVAAVIAVAASNQMNPSPANKSGASVFTTPTPTPTASTSATQPAADLFAVPELGVKFAKSDLTSDLVYTIKAVDGHPAAYFSSSRLKAGGGAACSEANGPLGVLRLEPTTSQAVEEMSTIGSNYLNFELPKQPCSLKTDLMVTSSQQTQALRVALQKLTVSQ